MREGGRRTAREAVARWEHEIAIALARRRAAMSRAVLPRLSGVGRWLAWGCTEGKPKSDVRCRAIEEESDWGDEADQDGEGG